MRPRGFWGPGPRRQGDRWHPKWPPLNSPPLFLCLSPRTNRFFFSSLIFPFCFETSCRTTFEDLGDFEKFVLWGVWELLVNFYLRLYWFHKETRVFLTLFCCFLALMPLIYFFFFIPPLELNLVVIRSEANWGLVNNLHIYSEHLTPDSLEENEGNKKYMRRFDLNTVVLMKLSCRLWFNKTNNNKNHEPKYPEAHLLKIIYQT